jgi:hypothetical protein
MSHHREETSVHRAVAQRSVVEHRSHDRNTDAWAPVLEPALLARIQQLNRDYLELLVAEKDSLQPGAQLQHLPPRQRTALRALSTSALSALAATPYTLYSLGFEDESFWESVCASTTASVPETVTQRYAHTGDASAHYIFCKLALLHAWHVAATNTMAARVVFAMPLVTARRLADMPLWQVRCIAASYEVLMLPRWPTNPAFWPDLIRFAAMNDVWRLQTTRLLGLQLIAAELEVACAMSHRDPRIVPSPRLRARKLQMERRGR